MTEYSFFVDLPIEYPTLSYRELEQYALLLAPVLNGARIERVFIPEAPAHPKGFFKNTFALGLYARDQKSMTVVLALRAKACGVVVYQNEGLRPAKGATHSGLDLTLHKELTGGKIISVTAAKGDRLLKMEVSKDEIIHSLLLHLIPAKPKLELLSGSAPLPAREVSPEVEAKIPFREHIFASLAHYQGLWKTAETTDALKIRKDALLSKLQNDVKSISKKIESLETQSLENSREPDWNYFGTLLQTHFYAKPKSENGFYVLKDYEKDQDVQVPADNKLALKEQLEKYFHLAKRKQRREIETVERIQGLREKLSMLHTQTEKVSVAVTLADLILATPLDATPGSGLNDKKVASKLFDFSGKQYVSREGLTILSGRNKIENTELTFKIARGNDLWFHVKGRPGAHTVVLLPPKKSASLETLLDAAEICLLHSNGKDWGRTEVDYTFRKHVKKIKNQTEVTYTHNKTLIVQVTDERIKRLFQA